MRPKRCSKLVDSLKKIEALGLFASLQSLMIRSAPQNCGRRVLPSLIDQRANAEHTLPFVSIPDSDGRYRDISYRELANAINRCAKWLFDQVGKSSSFATLGYIGPHDLRYHILIMAAVKTGHVVRNNIRIPKSTMMVLTLGLAFPTLSSQ